VFVVTGAPATSRSPNILWIVTDDQRPDSLACFNLATTGQSNSALGPVRSPGIDRLAKRGTLFTHAYANAPSCAPSRASMMTGRYPHHSGIYGFELAHERTENFKPLIPEVLKGVGYQTANFGKPGYYIFSRDKTWDFRGEFETSILPYSLEQKGMTDIKHDVTKKHGVSTRTEVFYVEDKQGQIREEPRLIEDISRTFALTPGEKKLGIVRSLSFEENKGEILAGRCPRSQTRDDFILDAFLSFLAHPNADYTASTGFRVRGARTDQPKLIHLGFHFPHTPVIPPQAFRDAFPLSAYQIPQFDAEELAALSPQLREYQRRWDSSGLSRNEQLLAIRDYYAFCAFGDTLVARAADAFQAFSEKEGRPWVMVYVCGDNGWHLGENGVMAKFGPYEKSTRQAILAVSSDPSLFPRGKVVDRLVEFVDIAPTLYDLAGIDRTQAKWDYLDGRNLSAEALGQRPEREYVISEMDPGMGPRAALRTKEFVFSMRTRPPAGVQDKDFRWAVTAGADEVETALFDLRKDPMERRNVSADPAYARLVRLLRDKLEPIVLGDRTEADWAREGRNFVQSTWGKGADDKLLPLPPASIPAL
jgi:arylsulfatase A-like enzyme